MFILRIVIYLVLVTCVVQVITLEGFQNLSLANYSEKSLTEYLQSSLLALSAFLFLCASIINQELKLAARMTGSLMAMMLVRESDAMLDNYAFDGAWQMIVLMIISVLLFSLRGQFRKAYSSLKSYTRQSSFGTFLAGMIVVLAFSRMMGRGSFWHAVMGESYMRVVKNIVEEGIETLGYSLITIAAVELIIFCLSARSTNTIEKSSIQKKCFDPSLT